VTIGPFLEKHPAQPWKLSDLLAEMKHCSISGALVSHRLAVRYDPMYGNRLLCGELENHGNLHPIWNVIPHHSGQFPDPEELFGQMTRFRVRAVTAYPKTCAWDLLAQGSAVLFAGLEKRRLLTILRSDELEGFRDLEALLSRYPELPVLLSHAKWSEQRYVMPLMVSHPNLYLTFNHYQIMNGLEWLVHQGLEDRLLYSSNFSEMCMGAHRSYVAYARISDAQKAKIAGGNLRRLLQCPQPLEPRANPDEDELMRAARLGEPLPVPVVDSHMHVLHD